ncbi:hypothetical protein ACPV5R_18730 [Vibrio astriarenae]
MKNRAISKWFADDIDGFIEYIKVRTAKSDIKLIESCLTTSECKHFDGQSALILIASQIDYASSIPNHELNRKRDFVDSLVTNTLGIPVYRRFLNARRGKHSNSYSLRASPLALHYKNIGARIADDLGFDISKKELTELLLKLGSEQLSKHIKEKINSPNH